MIVKNEEHVISRCMRSFAPVADYFIICDTGSTDKTIEVIKKTAAELNLPGEVHEHPWKNFAHNRSLSLKLGKQNAKTDYLLVIDADEVLKYRPDPTKNMYYEIEELKQVPDITMPKLDKDCYNILSKLNSITYDRLQLLSTRLDWRYESVVHEYAFADGIRSLGKVEEFMNMPRIEGARSMDPNKYLKDALVLEKGLINEPTNSRYYFYLAQSYRDASQYEKSIENYKKRLTMNGFEEEVNVCYHQLGFCSKQLGKPLNEWLHYYLEGYHKFPHRLECFYEYIKELRESGKSRVAYEFGKHAIMMPYPKNDQLFILKDIYVYLFKFEMALCALDIKKYNEAIILMMYTLQNEPDLPEERIPDLVNNVKKVALFLGKHIDDVFSQVKVSWNKENILESKVEYIVDSLKLTFVGNKENWIKVLNTIQYNTSKARFVDNVKTYDDNTLYMYIAPPGIIDRWNVVLIQQVQQLTEWLGLLELDKILQKKFLGAKKDVKLLRPFLNISRDTNDILFLGVPSKEQLQTVLDLASPNNRIFIFNMHEKANEQDELQRMMANRQNIFIGNIKNSPFSNRLEDIFKQTNVKDVRIGWVILLDDAFVESIDSSPEAPGRLVLRGPILGLQKEVAAHAYWDVQLKTVQKPENTLGELKKGIKTI